LVEKLAQSSFEKYGKYSTRYDNYVLASSADALELADDILSLYSEPRRILKMQTKGIVDLYPNEIITVTEPTILKIDNMAITKCVELEWNNYPSAFNNYVEAVKTVVARSRGSELGRIMKLYLPDPRLIIVPALSDTTAGNIETDFSGTGNNATYVATVSSDKDAIGKTPILNLGASNTTKYMTVADNSNLSFGDGTTDQPFSICAWINKTKASYAVQGSIGGKWRTTALAREYLFYLYLGGLRFLLIDQSAGSYMQVYCNIPVGVKFVCATYDGSSLYTGMKIYINGVSQTLSTANSGVYVAMENGNSTYRIGTGGELSYPYSGELGIQAVTGGELSASTIATIFENTRDYYGV
jgi:hypothetical protein